MNKTKILSIAKKVLKIELKSINSIKTSFDNNFYLAVKKNL